MRGPREPGDGQVPAREPTLPAGIGRRRRLYGGYRVLVTRPGAIPVEKRRQLLPSLVAVSTAAFGVDTAGVWQERLEGGWFDRVDRLLLILDAGGEMVGWTSYRTARIAGARAVYMDSTGLVPRHQRHGLVPTTQSRVVRRLLARRPWRPLYVVYRTRSPVTLRGLLRTFGTRNVAPRPGGEAPTWARNLAIAMHRNLAEPGELDAHTLTVRRAYAERGVAIYGDAQTPQSGEPEIDRHFDQHLGPEDAFLIIVRVTLRGILAARR